jgi:hypothetical protein
MDPLEQFLIALVAAIASALAGAIAPVVVQQAQQPSTAQDAYADTDLQTQITHAIENPK